MKNPQFQILLYYKYVDVPIPEKEMLEQKKLCERLNLKGRIILGREGINGTLEGAIKNTEKYISAMNQSKYFTNIHFKKSTGTGIAFKKLSVRVRPEIVTSKVPNLNPTKVTGKYISAQELHEWIENRKKFYIVDMRNDYEYASGYFEGSIFSGMHNFFDLGKTLPKLQHLKNETVVTVCTGGIRCEKASGFLVQNGFADVYQLLDGIQTYMELYPNEHFKGKLYVFDGRLTLGFDTNNPKHKIVGKCMLCGKTSEQYVNCAEDVCHYHFIGCEECRDKETKQFFCKQACKETYIKNKTVFV